MALTKRQTEVMAFLRKFKAECGFPPTRVEIAQHFGFRSPNAAEEHLQALHRKGELFITRGCARGIAFPDREPTSLPATST
jgi:repressor LexA